MTNDELRALAKEATGGTWYVAGARSTRVHTNCPKVGGYTVVCECEADGDQHLHDARYIAAANPAREVRRLQGENEQLKAVLAQRLPRDVEDAFYRVHHDLCVREVDRTDGGDLALLEKHGLMWSRVLTEDDEDSRYETHETGDTVYEWTRAGLAEIRKIEAARAALEGK